MKIKEPIVLSVEVFSESPLSLKSFMVAFLNWKIVQPVRVVFFQVKSWATHHLHSAKSPSSAWHKLTKHKQAIPLFSYTNVLLLKFMAVTFDRNVVFLTYSGLYAPNNSNYDNKYVSYPWNPLDPYCMKLAVQAAPN